MGIGAPSQLRSRWAFVSMGIGAPSQLRSRWAFVPTKIEAPSRLRSRAFVPTRFGAPSKLRSVFNSVSPHFPALFGDNPQSSHVSVQSATDVQPPSVTSSMVADRSCGSAACSAIVRRRDVHPRLTFPVNSLMSHGPATSSAE